ncbi:MAG: hypothetical protein LBE91_07620 [Tannerella sp.]|jgi:hypothetical protein|nr:hypothetical protein [Tannerella sp.]
MKTVKTIMLFLLSVSIFAQKESNHIRAGVGMGITSDKGGSLAAEYGKTFHGLEAGIALSIFTSSPFNTKDPAIDVVNWNTEEEFVGGVFTDNFSDIRDISLIINVGYNLLSLIPKNSRHYLTPFVGYGISQLSQVNYLNGGNNRRLYLNYDNRIGGNFVFGIRYEYELTETVRLGLYFSRYQFSEQNIAGINICRTF